MILYSLFFYNAPNQSHVKCSRLGIVQHDLDTKYAVVKGVEGGGGGCWKVGLGCTFWLAVSKQEQGRHPHGSMEGSRGSSQRVVASPKMVFFHESTPTSAHLEPRHSPAQGFCSSTPYIFQPHLGQPQSTNISEILVEQASSRSTCNLPIALNCRCACCGGEVPGAQPHFRI